MEITPSFLDKFKKLYQETYKEEISDKDAYQQASALLWLVKKTYRPMTKTEYRKYYGTLKKI